MTKAGYCSSSMRLLFGGGGTIEIVFLNMMLLLMLLPEQLVKLVYKERRPNWGEMKNQCQI
jgi:hypothetical protein